MTKIRPLSKELQQLAKLELNEVPERIDEDLSRLREWIAKTPHLRARTDDKFLIVFLRGCKFSLEKAKEKLEAFYTLRAQTPEVFSNRRVTTELLNIARSGGVISLPHTNGPTGSRIVLARPGLFPNFVHFHDILKVLGMGQDNYLIEDDNSSVAGSTLILDLNNTTTDFLHQLTLSLIKRVIAAWLQGNPMRFKAFYVVNMKPFWANLVNLVKMLLSEKLRSRVSAYHNT